MKKILITINLLLSIAYVAAQGCSDAGFCSIANLRQHGLTANYKQKISVHLTNGIGDENVYVFTPAIQYDNQLSNRWSLQGKLTGNYASGNLGSTAALGDIYVSATYKITPQKKWKTSFALGLKLPLNDANLKKGNIAYPMQYQSSLGTTDLIIGINMTNKRWQFATGWQQPITTRNNNGFLPSFWSNAAAKAFAPTNQFGRKGDVLLRASYIVIPTGSFTLTTGLLGIAHLGEDTYINGGSQSTSLKGSNGVTLNGTVAAWYKAGKRINIGLNIGAPFVVRDIRPDGLTRKFSISPEISYSF